jgi:hypothetical protein
MIWEGRKPLSFCLRTGGKSYVLTGLHPSMRQKEFIKGCYDWYREADLQPGNPDDGEWQECHYPLPKCLGGTETILLLKEHHAIQGVLQSEEYQHPCIFSWEKDFLGEPYLSLWLKWMKIKGQKMVEHRKTNGFHHSNESKEKIRKAMTGDRNPMFGKPRPESVRQAIGEANKNRVFPEHKKEMYRQKFSGEGNPMYGRGGEQHPAFGKKWWVSESGTTKFQRECPGEGWKQGRNWYN